MARALGLTEQQQAVIGAITIDLPSFDTVMGAALAALAGDSPPTVLMSANLDHIHHFAGPAATLRTGIAAGARWLTLLDGRPVLNAVRRRGAMGAVAIPGSDLLAPVLDLAAARGARVALIGGGDATRAYWSDVLPVRRPGLVMAGVWPVRWADLDRPGAGAVLAATIALARPDILIVSLGKPRQELWLHDHMTATGARLALPVGSAADYLAGTARRPPAWVRQLGAEWLLRLIREPRRLWRRYLLEGPPAYLTLRRDLRVSDLGAVLPSAGCGPCDRRPSRSS
jgi:exopolysaccharide biosynthesis WecB/TagA/CpsF family protein